jgi:hypothetical protein
MLDGGGDGGGLLVTGTGFGGQSLQEPLVLSMALISRLLPCRSSRRRRNSSGTTTTTAATTVSPRAWGRRSCSPRLLVLLLLLLLLKLHPPDGLLQPLDLLLELAGAPPHRSGRLSR